ncbi:MAG TPA: carboxypeptidase-like regulatory domain-containing protein, partial [Thermoanaerobaculia bacterium]|nr:carboxypeptidase-like regulatory domain-containing protein [Thermoanaerobaculia bacterium]
DAANSITLTEQLMYQGTGSQSGTCSGTCTRWGDYSGMTLDPDGCTFWYTNEYYATTGLNHQTRIGYFKYASCTPVGAGGTVTGTVTATVGGAPISGATVSLGARNTTTNSSGVYSFTGIPAGTYPTISASYAGYATSTSTNVVVTDGGTTTRNFSLSTASSGSCLVDTTQADFNAGLQTNLDVTSSPGDIKLSKPDILDQQNTNTTNSGFGFTSTSWVGQTFQPAISGQLTRVDLDLFCSTCTGTAPNLTVSIRATTSDLPTGADLATATIPGFTSGAGGFFTATFATPATVTAGTRYAVVVRPVSNPSAGTYAYVVSPSNVYTNGRWVQSGNSGATWSAGTTGTPPTSRDLGFKVYINAGFSTSGDLISSLKDGNPALGNRPTWTTLSWTGTTPASTAIKFQAAGSNSANGPFNFVGPDGTAATFFTTSGASIAQFNGFRFLEYRAYLTTSNTANTPTLSDVTVCFADASCASSPPTITPTPAVVCPNATGRTATGPAGMANYSWGVTNGTIVGPTNSQSITYTAGASGTVDLELTTTDGTGCVKSNTLSVTIDVVPTPTISSSGTTFCGSGTLTSSAASGNQWYLGGVPIGGATNTTYNATASGSYTVRVTDTNGCTSAMSAATVITINALPPTPTISAGGPTTFCTGGSVTLTSSAATGNQWNLNGSPIGGATGTTYNATAGGNYTVTVTNGSGCSATSSTTSVTVNPLPPTPTITPGGPTTFCAGGSVTLTSSAATGNQWKLNGS